MAKEVHELEYDPAAHDLEGEVVMRAGGGKKHGQYFLSDSVIDTASTPMLSQIRAWSTGANSGIRQQPTATHFSVLVISILLIVRSFLTLVSKHYMFTLDEML